MGWTHRTERNYRLSLGLSKISMGYSSLSCPCVSYMTLGDGILKFDLRMRDPGIGCHRYHSGRKICLIWDNTNKLNSSKCKTYTLSLGLSKTSMGYNAWIVLMSLIWPLEMAYSCSTFGFEMGDVDVTGINIVVKSVPSGTTSIWWSPRSKKSIHFH